MGRQIPGLREPNFLPSFHNVMDRPRSPLSVSLLACLLVWAAPAAWAQDSAQSESADPKAETAAPARKRAISGDMAAALAASMPKYNPPPKPAERKDGEDVDMRDVDKPRNGIIRLPKYVVQEQKPPVFTEREISTSKGLAAIALRRYFTETTLALNAFTVPLFGISKEAYAEMLYSEDERLKNISDLNSTANDVNLINPANAKAIREATRDTYFRGYDYTYIKRN